MKTLSLTILFFFTIFNLNGQADAIEKYFSKYKDDESFTMVYVSPKMFQMFAKVAGNEVDEDIKDVISDLRGLRILTTEDNSLALYKEAKSLINTSEYEELITVRDGKENVKFMVKDDGLNGDIVHELLLLVGGDDDFVLMSFVGDIDLDKLSKLAHSIDIDGLEHLDKIKKKN